MDALKERQLVADTGRVLVEKGLVARTWGNISARVSDTKFAISPSGLGYANMTADDVPIFDLATDSYEGSRKPSSEKKIHGAAYEIFPEASFVVHTHQDYATVLGLVGTKDLDMSEEEKALLGKIEVADYGLPGTNKLKKNVKAAYEKGSKVVLMLHHGAVIVGNDCDDAIHKAVVLEEVCKRAVEKVLAKDVSAGEAQEINQAFINDNPGASVISDNNILNCAAAGGIKAQLDDIVQMTGARLKSVDNRPADISSALSKQDAVFVKNVGCVIKADDEEDVEALKLLVTKAALASRFTALCKANKFLSLLDCKIMRYVYIKKYSKKKEG